jgi:hypothetical protein
VAAFAATACVDCQALPVRSDPSRG